LKLLGLLLLSALISAIPPSQGSQKAQSLVYGFVGPRIIKAHKNANTLYARDINADGISDLVYLKPDASEIVLLLRGKDGNYTENVVAPDRNVRKLVLGQFNGDKRVDLAFIEPGEHVIVLYQDKKGKFGQEREFDAKATDLYAGDLNGDGRDDLIALSEESFLCFYQKPGHALPRPVKIANPCKAVRLLDAADLDGNGMTDIILRHPSRRSVLPVRFQTARGVFAMEVQFETKDHVPVRACRLRPGDKKARLLSIRNRTHALKLLELRQEPNPKLTMSLPRTFGFSNSTSKKCFAVADFTGKGKREVLVVDSATAQMSLYVQDDRGLTGEFNSFPCLADVSQIAVIQSQDGKKSAVVMASPEEKILAVTETNAKGAFPFPVKIEASRIPAGVVALGEKGGVVELAVLEKEKKDAFRLVLLKRGQDKKYSRAEKPIHESRGSHIEAVRAVQANGDGKTDILLFVRYSDPILLIRQLDGAFGKADEMKGFERGLFTRLKPSALSQADVDGDGVLEMLLARKNFARGLAMDSMGAVSVKTQYNGAEPTSRIVRAEMLDVDADGHEDVLLFDAAKGGLEISVMTEDKSGIHTHQKTFPIGAMTLSEVFKADFNGDKRDDLLLAADDRMAVILAGSADPKLVTVAAYKTKIKDGSYLTFYSGDVGGDAASEILAVESNKHFLEILSFDGEKIKQELSFKIYEKREDIFRGFFFRQSGQTEPKSLRVADVDGDGLRDVAILIHENILIYRREP